MCVAIPFVLITLAPRYISAAEVNLFFLLETILGPIWVWLVIKEQPSTETIIGGIVILSATIIYFLTVPINWLSYVGIILGGLLLNIGAAAIFLIKKLKLDIKSSH